MVRLTSSCIVIEKITSCWKGSALVRITDFSVRFCARMNIIGQRSNIVLIMIFAELIL